jgi:threonine dehydrogenase-like Zn-dependent dehydrogenase
VRGGTCYDAIPAQETRRMHVKAAYLKAPWQIELRTIDLPDTPPPGWVRVRVEACGICGTDLTAAAETARDWKPFGHEIAGERLISHTFPLARIADAMRGCRDDKAGTIKVVITP